MFSAKLPKKSFIKENQSQGYWLEMFYLANNYFLSSNNNIRLTGSKLIYNQIELDLKDKQSSLQIVKLLINLPNRLFSREELLNSLYGDITSYSYQLQSSIKHNLIKRISRTRKLLINSFKDSRIDWLPYDKNSKNWCLFKINMNYNLENNQN